MPLFDRICARACGWTATDVWEPVCHPAPPCPSCGSVTARAWLSKPSAVVGDEMDHWQENGTREPIHFTSKQERKRWMKAQGYHDAVRHVPLPGSDRSPHTINWASTYDPYTAANVQVLLERAFHAGTTHAPEESPLPHATFYDRTPTEDEVKRYAER